MARYLLRLPTLILLAANLVPLVGVLFWHWDGFLLLMLYWMETAVIAFWTIVRILLMPAESLSELKWGTGAQVTSRLGTAGFFTFHAGIFMAVHFLFLWELFSGDWAARVHGIRDFIDQIVIESGLWAPLLVLFIARGVMAFLERLRPLLQRLRLVSKRAPEEPIKIETILFGLYSRIFVLQVTIILGAWFAMMFGGPLTLAVVILIKTAVDLALYAGIDLARWGARPSKVRPAEVP